METLNELIQRCRKNRYAGWNEDELAECLEKAKLLDEKELLQLFNTKWLTKDDPFKRKLFHIVYKETLEIDRDSDSKTPRGSGWSQESTLPNVYLEDLPF